MNDNSYYKSCVNRSSSRSPSREQSVAIAESAGDIGTPAFRIEEQLNEVYEKRLADINEQAEGDATLKETTYKEWITTLRQINKTLITNIQHMERETTERLDLLQRKVSLNCRNGSGSELCKCRNDMAGLMQLVRNGRRLGDWTTNKIKFETITENDIFGNDTSYCEPPMKYEHESSNEPNNADPRSSFNQKAKLIANVKALAFEVADKHDEIRDLKKQILSMEDEIQKAQKKIQLKDDVIRELRNDLKALPKSPAIWKSRLSDLKSPNTCLPISGESNDMEEDPATPRPDSSYSNRHSINSLNCSPLDIYGINIHEDEDEDDEFRKRLKDELSQFFEMRDNYDQNVEVQKRAMQDQQHRLIDHVDKLVKSNISFQNKVIFYRRELLNLENPESCKTATLYSDADSGICSDLDSDMKIVNSVRNRISCLIEENHRMRKEDQCLKTKLEDIISEATAKSELLDKTSRTLKEVVDALSNADCQNMTGNPIVEAFDDLLKCMNEQEKTICELQKRIAYTEKTNKELENNSQMLESELCELKELASLHSQNENGGMLFQNNEFSKKILIQAEKYQKENLAAIQQENQNEYLRIIDDLSSELNTLSDQVNMVHKEFPTDEIAKEFESSLKGLEAQNDMLQSAVETLIDERKTIERTLQAQNEDLKNKLCTREQEVDALRNRITQIEQRPCARCAAARFQAECAQREQRGTPRVDSNEELNRLTYELKKRGKTVEYLELENSRLNAELMEVRKRNTAKIKFLEKRGVGESSGGSNERVSSNQELITKLNAAQEKNNEQGRSLQKAVKEIICLRQAIEDLRASEVTFIKERDLLQTELIALKEIQASKNGTQQSLQEQLEGTMNELYDAKRELHASRQINENIKSAHHDSAKVYEDIKAKMFDKYNKLVEDYNKVLQEYQKVSEIEKEKTNQIIAFNAWKDEQIKIERNVRQKMQMFEHHIKEMLEDKQNLLDRISQTEIDNRTLMQAMGRLKSCSLGNPSRGASSPSSGYTVVGASASTDPVSKVIENVRNTSRKLSQQRCILEDEASRYLSK